MEIGKEQGDIRSRVVTESDFNDYEAAYFKVICSNQRRKYRTDWSNFLTQNLGYK